MTSPANMEVLAAAVAADVPALLWGSPGTAKTSYVRALSKILGAHLEVLVGAHLDVTDVSGVQVPVPVNLDVDGAGSTAEAVERARRALVEVPPAWLARVTRALAEGKRVVLFLDEFTNAPRSVHAQFLRLVQERRVGAFDLRGCAIVAAANPPDQAADGMELSAASANRFVHIQWDMDVSAWAAALMGGFADPPAFPAAREVSASDVARARALVARFVTRAPQYFNALPKDPAAQGQAWPSPRSWDNATRLFACFGADPDATGCRAAVAGCVGAEAAEAFFVFVREQDVPDPEALLADPERAELPSRVDRLHTAIMAACVAACAAHQDQAARWLAAWRLLDRVPVDVALLGAKELSGAWMSGRVKGVKPPATAEKLLKALRAAQGKQGAP